jgi:NAD-dependent dihydropyrimidine dehydrogenase PreA subunit
MPENNPILFCQCSERGILSDEAKRAARAEFCRQGRPFTEVADLCGCVANRDRSLLALAASAAKLTVAACHPRAVRWLLHAAGLAVEGDRLEVLDLRTAALSATPAPPPCDIPAKAAPATDDWPPWFPVIDYARCRQCRQCLSFCLFGVYELSKEGKVAVANPRSCKNNCPACARICPEVAILFPKLPDAEAPLNGEEVGDEKDWKARARIKTQEILGDDVYAALAERRKKARGRRLLNLSREKAEEERAACASHNAGKANAAVTPPPPEH